MTYQYHRKNADSPFAKKQLKELTKAYREAKLSLEALETDLSALMTEADKMAMRSEDEDYEREASEVLGQIDKAYMRHLKEVDALVHKAGKSLDQLSRKVK